jgi:hypothetical protein
LLDAELFLDADAIWTMLEMIEADVLIMAKGSFSYVAALISDGIKLCEPCGEPWNSGWNVLQMAPSTVLPSSISYSIFYPKMRKQAFVLPRFGRVSNCHRFLGRSANVGGGHGLFRIRRNVIEFEF